MRFGIFGGAIATSPAPGAAMGQGFHDYIDFNVEAEALGYHSTFLVEHHFTGWNQVSATLTLLTWLAARTRTLRLGTAVLVLPWHNPVLLAEQVATLDLMSGGRFDFGVGKGYRHSEFTGFRIPQGESEARFEEALALILKAWTSEGRFSHHGPHYQFDDIVVEPPTKQKPHPPIWMGAGNPASIRKVAERGHNLILDQFASAAQTGAKIDAYRQALEAHGRRFVPMHVALARDMYVAKDEADKDAAIVRNEAAHQRTLSVSRSPDRQGGSHILAYDDKMKETRANTLIGTPDEIMGKLEALREAGVEYVILSTGGSRESLRRFAHEIMPAFADAPAARAASA